MDRVTDFSFITISILFGVTFITFGIWYLVQYGESKIDSVSVRSDKKLSGRILFFLICWAIVSSVLGWAEIFQATENSLFPTIVLDIVFPLFAGIFLLSRSKRFEEILNHVPQHWLVGFQIYRSLGILFLLMYSAGKLPGVFAIPAGIGDLVIGLSAPIVAFFHARNYKKSCLAVLVWNLVGIADLLLALTLGFLSSPGLFQLLSLDNPTTLITAFPLVLVPIFAVPFSIVLHLASMKKLKRSIQRLDISNQKVGNCMQGRFANCES